MGVAQLGERWADTGWFADMGRCEAHVVALLPLLTVHPSCTFYTAYLTDGVPRLRRSKARQGSFSCEQR